MVKSTSPGTAVPLDVRPGLILLVPKRAAKAVPQRHILVLGKAPWLVPVLIPGQVLVLMSTSVLWSPESFIADVLLPSLHAEEGVEDLLLENAVNPSYGISSLHALSCAYAW